MTSEEQENLEFARVLDSEDEAIRIKTGGVTLRELLTAVHVAQAEDTRWITKFIGKRPVSGDDIMWELPTLSAEALEPNEEGKGSWFKYYTTIKERLRRLCDLGFLYSDIKYSQSAKKYIYYYGLKSPAEGFVNYNEKIEST